MSDHVVDNSEDLKLVAQCRSGDTRAFEKLVVKHQRSIYNIVLRIISNEVDAAEIAQETFLSAWRKISDFRGDAKFSTWLTSIAINQARSRWQYNQRKRTREESLDCGDETLDGPPLQVASEQPSALEMMEQSQLRELLARCIEALEQGFREVLVLRDMRDMAYDEIGRILGLRDGTVKSRLFRAREAVKDCVSKGMGKK